jgi:hypothetical protein
MQIPRRMEIARVQGTKDYVQELYTSAGYDGLCSRVVHECRVRRIMFKSCTRVQGTTDYVQELYKVLTRADGKAVREDDAEPEVLEDDGQSLGDGEPMAMAVKEALLDLADLG